MSEAQDYEAEKATKSVLLEVIQQRDALMDAFNDQAAELERLLRELDGKDKLLDEARDALHDQAAERDAIALHSGEAIERMEATIHDQAAENERLRQEVAERYAYEEKLELRVSEAEATIERLRAALGRANAHVIDAMATIGQQEATIEELKEALLEWFFDPDNVPVLAARLAREHNAPLTGKEQE